MRQKLWRKKKFVVMAAAFACIAALSACGKKDTDYNVDVGNGVIPHLTQDRPGLKRSG